MRRWLPWLAAALILLAAAELLAGGRSRRATGNAAGPALPDPTQPPGPSGWSPGAPTGEVSTPRAGPDRRGVASAVHAPAGAAAEPGGAEGGSADGPAAVERAPARGLQVEVVDADGAPVEGVEVELQLSIEGSSGHGEVDRATTDGAGLAVLLSTADDQREAWRAHVAQLGTAVRYRVEARVPLEPAPSAELGPDPERAERVRLELPPTGSLSVRVTRPDGSPAPERCSVSCATRPRGSDGAFEHRRGLSAAVTGGLAELPLVPLDRELRITAGGGGHRGGELVCAGPERAGQRVEATVVLGPPLPRIAGRLVGLDGAPLTGVQVAVETLLVPRAAPPGAGPEPGGGRWTELDAQGRFERELDLEPGPTERLVVRIHEESRFTPGSVDRFARWDGVVAPRPGEVIELGTLVLAPDANRRLLVSGTLRAADGEELRMPAVDAWARDPESGRWERLAEDRVEVTADGSFEVWTVRPELPESFRLSAGARGWLGTSLTVAPGARVELVLERAGALTGRFTAADSAVLPLLVAEVRCEDHSRDPNIFLGAFQVEGLPPGTYSVTALGRGGSWRFGSVEGLVVRRGETTRDPRLDPLDLGAACRLLRLRLTDAAGVPLGRTVAWLHDSEGKAHRQADAEGVVAVLVPSTTTALEVGASSAGGHLRAVWTPAAGDEATLVLR